MVIYNLSTNKFTVKIVPSDVDPASAAVSKDGKYVAYQTYGVNNGYEMVVNHIFNVGTGKDVVVAAEGLALSSGAHDLRFSPDGAYLSNVGHYAADTQKAGMAIQIISVKDGSLVRQIDREGVQNIVTGIGWAGDHTMVYSTNSSPNGIFNSEQDSVYSINPGTNQIFNFPNGLGEPIFVLNYHR